MSDMKCTKCNSDLEQIGDFFTCTNPYCTLCGDKNIWQELITTKKALDLAIGALKKIDWCAGDYAKAQEALEQIESITKAKEQK